MLRHIMLATILSSFLFPEVAPGQEKPDLAERIGSLVPMLIAAKKSDTEITDTLFLVTLIRAPKDNEKDAI